MKEGFGKFDNFPTDENQMLEAVRKRLADDETRVARLREARKRATVRASMANQEYSRNVRKFATPVNVSKAEASFRTTMAMSKLASPGALHDVTMDLSEQRKQLEKARELKSKLKLSDNAVDVLERYGGQTAMDLRASRTGAACSSAASEILAKYASASAK